MLRLFGMLFASLLLTGCVASNGLGEGRYSFFQSVEKKDALLVQNGKNKQYCYVCGMDLVKYYKTSHTAQDSTKFYQYCSLHCLEDHLGSGITLKNPQVVDVTSLKLIPVGNAHYVVGSRIRGTMSQISKYAFENFSDAQKFQHLNGGEIMNFHQAREKAQEDFKNYRNRTNNE